MQYEQKNFKCTEFEKSYNQAENLKRHWREHHEQKPYSFTQCGQSFTNSDSLKKIFRIIVNKPYNCEKCGIIV